jgi:hypothetical protein
MNLRLFCFGLFRNLWILVIEPLLDRLWPLLVGLFDRLLRRKTPALQVVANRANRQLDAALLLNELTYGSAISQRKFHLELLGALVANEALHLLFLLRRGLAFLPSFASNRLGA